MFAFCSTSSIVAPCSALTRRDDLEDLLHQLRRQAQRSARRAAAASGRAISAAGDRQHLLLAARELARLLARRVP
jgi:hypothetical protein